MKKKYELEYPLNASPQVLYNMLSTPAGLSEWFANDVNLQGSVFTFLWEGTEESAEVLMKKENKLIRFHWIDDDNNKTYFEFRINQHELTGDVSLEITDFCPEDEKEESIELWDTQIARLKHVIGI